MQNGVYLTGSVMENAVLTRTNLKNAKLKDVQWGTAFLRGARF